MHQSAMISGCYNAEYVRIYIIWVVADVVLVLALDFVRLSGLTATFAQILGLRRKTHRGN